MHTTSSGWQLQAEHWPLHARAGVTQPHTSCPSVTCTRVSKNPHVGVPRRDAADFPRVNMTPVVWIPEIGKCKGSSLLSCRACTSYQTIPARAQACAGGGGGVIQSAWCCTQPSALVQAPITTALCQLPAVPDPSSTCGHGAFAALGSRQACHQQSAQRHTQRHKAAATAPSADVARTSERVSS